jgi:ribosomal protein L32
MKRILRFIKALWFHINAGLPKTTQSEINHRFSICSQCDMYDRLNSLCLECGCNINNKKIFMNKLAWADQHCPLNKWNKIER